MNEKAIMNLELVLISIEIIESHLGATKNFKEYENNLVLQDAVSLRLAAIGEATRSFTLIEPNISLTNSRAIIGLRNRIVHAYDSVEHSSIWKILIND